MNSLATCLVNYDHLIRNRRDAWPKQGRQTQFSGIGGPGRPLDKMQVAVHSIERFLKWSSALLLLDELCAFNDANARRRRCIGIPRYS